MAERDHRPGTQGTAQPRNGIGEPDRANPKRQVAQGDHDEEWTPESPEPPDTREEEHPAPSFEGESDREPGPGTLPPPPGEDLRGEVPPPGDVDLTDSERQLPRPVEDGRRDRAESPGRTDRPASRVEVGGRDPGPRPRDIPDEKEADREETVPLPDVRTIPNRDWPER
jgi:hypothetical protein